MLLGSSEDGPHPDETPFCAPALARADSFLAPESLPPTFFWTLGFPPPERFVSTPIPLNCVDSLFFSSHWVFFLPSLRMRNGLLLISVFSRVTRD